MAGEDYCIVAADTRMSTGFSIMTRDCKKIMQLCAPFPRARAPRKRKQALRAYVARRATCSTARKTLYAPGIGACGALHSRLRARLARRARSGADLHARGARALLVRVAPCVTRAPDARSLPPRTRSSDTCVIGSPGFLADAVTLQKHLHARQIMYQHNHGAPMSCPAMAQVRFRFPATHAWLREPRSQRSLPPRSRPAHSC